MSNQEFPQEAAPLPAPQEPGRRLSLERQLLLWGLALAVVLAVAVSVRAVLTPFVAGAVLGYLLDPVADRLQKMGLSRLGAALLLLSLFTIIFGAALLLLAPVLARQLEGFVSSMPDYLAALQTLFSEWSEKITADYNALLKEHGLEASLPSLDLQKRFNDLAGEMGGYLADFARSILSRGVDLINILSVIVVTPVVAFYMLLDWDDMLKVMEELAPPRHRDDLRALAREIDKAMGGFFRGQSAVCLFLGSWYALGLSLIGLNFGFLIGVVAGFLSLIPFAGSIVAFVLSISIALVQRWPDWHLPLEAIAVVSVGLFLDGNVLSPRLVGGAVGLHPVWLMFALFAFGYLFGFVGLLLAVPLAAVSAVLIRFALGRYLDSPLYTGKRPS